MRTHGHDRTRAGRMPVVLGLGAAAALALASCAGSPGEGPAASTPASATQGTGSANAEATAGPGEGATSTSPGTGSGSATPAPSSDRPSRGPLDGPTQTYTTQSGVFTWTLPEDWTVDVERDSDTSDLTGGIPYESVEFSDPDGTVSFTATTGVGPTDSDGATPEVVEFVEAEELTGIPVAEKGGPGGLGTGPVYLQSVITRAVDPPAEGAAGSDPAENGEYGLALHVANVDEGSDPGDPEDFHDNWVYYLDPPADAGEQAYGTANFLSAGIDQEDAEEVTGLRGEEAVRAMLDSEEYATVRAVMTSMEVDLP